jgi:hypothetical protein
LPKARRDIRNCLSVREKTQPDSWPTLNPQSLLGGALLGQKKNVDSEPPCPDDVVARNGVDGNAQGDLCRQENLAAHSLVRRDCAPHRGRALYVMALLSLFLSPTSLVLFPIATIFPLAILVLRLAAQDLRLMDAGLMDPEGYAATDQARHCAFAALISTLIVGVCGAAILVPVLLW